MVNVPIRSFKLKFKCGKFSDGALAQYERKKRDLQTDDNIITVTKTNKYKSDNIKRNADQGSLLLLRAYR